MYAVFQKNLIFQIHLLLSHSTDAQAEKVCTALHGIVIVPWSFDVKNLQYFAFSIPCIMIKLLQCNPTNAHTSLELQ